MTNNKTMTMKNCYSNPRMLALIVVLFVVSSSSIKNADGYGITSTYRRKLAASVDMPMDADVFQVPPGFNAPEQVHITQGDVQGQAVIVSWTTPVKPDPLISYGPPESKYAFKGFGIVTRYTFYNYTSGFIHHCTLSNLKFNTTYYYKLGSANSTRNFTFSTPPQPGLDVPYIFGIIGDLGQTFDSNNTLHHYLGTAGQSVLFVGDLSYADRYPFHDNRRWDTWGRFVERSAAYQPWIWTAGNHEIDYVPEVGETEPFKPFTNRFHTPFNSSNSTAPFWYSIKRGPAYIIVLASYSSYGKYTPQYLWFQNELTKVNRTETPWLVILMHSPWYNSNVNHYMEGETMRVQFEAWLTQNKVDIVFAGHVHAYERSKRISNIAYNIENGNCTPVFNSLSPVYLTVGDGGNSEGLAATFNEPQPVYSAFREASFGHGLLEIKNRTHAYFSWHRNQDGDNVVGDSQWFYNRYWYPQEEPVSS